MLVVVRCGVLLRSSEGFPCRLWCLGCKFRFCRVMMCVRTLAGHRSIISRNCFLLQHREEATCRWGFAAPRVPTRNSWVWSKEWSSKSCRRWRLLRQIIANQHVGMIFCYESEKRCATTGKKAKNADSLKTRTMRQGEGNVRRIKFQRIMVNEAVHVRIE